MPWLEAAAPVRMARIAIVAPEDSLRDVLAQVADSGAAEIGQAAGDAGTPGPAARLLAAVAGSQPAGLVPALAAATPDLQGLAANGRHDLLAGEAALEARAAAAVRRSGAAGLPGWMPADRVAEVAARVADLGGAVVRLRFPRGEQAPTLLGGPPSRRALTPLVQTFGTVPYADIDPSWLAWFSYVLMFGMMFGDTGQGLLLIGAALALRAGWPPWARRYRAGWPFIGGAGVAATIAGLLYGEFFGPTGVIPTLWLNPVDKPVPLLLAAVAVGTALLAGAYALGTVNRYREGGWPLALYAPSGVAGTAVFLGFGVAAGGWYFHRDLLLAAGAVVAAAGLALAFAGFLTEAGGGGTGVTQASIELFDLVIRLSSNVVSFARLAAFGLTHAALGMLVWEGSRALWHRGGFLLAAAIGVFLAGNTLTFALEGLVAGIQALRLEYYELFSRVFQFQGRQFQPWHVPICGTAPVAGLSRGPRPVPGPRDSHGEERPCTPG